MLRGMSSRSDPGPDWVVGLTEHDLSTGVENIEGQVGTEREGEGGWGGREV